MIIQVDTVPRGRNQRGPVGKGEASFGGVRGLKREEAETKRPLKRGGS